MDQVVTLADGGNCTLFKLGRSKEYECVRCVGIMVVRHLLLFLFLTFDWNTEGAWAWFARSSKAEPGQAERKRKRVSECENTCVVRKQPWAVNLPHDWSSTWRCRQQLLRLLANLSARKLAQEEGAILELLC